MHRDELQNNYGRIIARLRHVRDLRERTADTRAIALVAAVVIGAIFLAILAEAVLYAGAFTRTILVISAALAMLAGTAYFGGASILRRMGMRPRETEDSIAREIGEAQPLLRDRLLNALQIWRESRSRNAPPYSLALIDAGFEDAAGKFESLDIDPIVDQRPSARALRICAVHAAIILLAFAAFPSRLSEAADRLVHFRTDYAPPAPFDFIVTPGDLEAVKGEPVVIRAATSLPTQPDISIHVRESTQSEFDTAPARRDSSGAAVHTVAALRSTLVYYVEADGFRSREFTVRVVDRPLVRRMRVLLTFPSYTRLPARVLDDNSGDITALAGTMASFECVLNKDVAEAAVVFGDSHRVVLTHGDLMANGSFRLLRDGTYHIDLKDAAGIRNVDPVRYSIQIVPDLHPTIEIVEPDAQTDLDEALRLPIRARIGDDFGFTRLLLHYRLAASKYEQAADAYTTMSIPLPAGSGKEAEVSYIWNLSTLGLVPEDVVEYFVEVFDNDNVGGPKSARSRMQTLRLPSMEEVFARADKTQDKAAEDLTKALSGAEDVQKQIENLQRELKQQNAEKMDWQQKRAMEEALKRQEKILDDIAKVKDQLARLNEDMQKQNLVSDETMKKYQELQDLMKQVDAPELREAMKRMNEAMKMMSPEQMKQALENFKFNEDSFRRSIERTIDLLKRLQIEQKAEELAKRSDDLASKQEDLAERTGKADPKNKEELERLAKEQNELREQAAAMQREMNELQKKMEEFPQDMPLSEMQEAQSEMNLSEMQQQMSEASGQCEGGNCSSASKGQKKLAEQMRKVQKKMEKVRKKLSENQERMVQQAFKRALDNVLDLSRKQENLRNTTASLPQNSQMFREMMQQQSELMDQLNNAANDLMELSKKSFSVTPEMGQHLGQAMRKMRESMQSMQNRNKGSSGDQMGGAMTELNEAAKQIAKGMQSSKSGGSSGGSMMSQLQRMAQQQMGINQGTQQMMQGGRMTPQQAASMQRLAQQQMALQKSLQQLNEEAKRSAEGKRLMGDMARIAEEMQEVVRDMQQGDVNPNTMQKQERILSRMLDASRSMRERDWEKQRKSETGRDIARRSPAQLDPSKLETDAGIKYDMQKALNEGYSRDYETLIRHYFEALEKVIGQN